MNNRLEKFLTPRRLDYIMVDQDFMIREKSLSVKRFAEIPEQVLEGNDVRIAFPELLGIEDIATAVLEGERKTFELKGLARYSLVDSTLLYLNIYFVGDQDEELSENRLFLFFEDVTESMVFEQSLVQASNEMSLLLNTLSSSKNYIEKIIAAMAELLIVTTDSGIIKKVNKAAQKLLEYSEEELLRQSISLIVSEPDLAALQHPIKSGGEILPHIETICQTKTGKNLVVEFSCSVLATDIEGLQNFLYIGRDMTERHQMQQSLKNLQYHQQQAENILLHILPQPIATRWQQEPHAVAEHFAEVTLLLADLCNFSEIAATLSPQEQVNLLNTIFSAFDQLTEKHRVEKIKTLGGTYLIAGGLPVPREDHAEAIAEMALEMQKVIQEFNAKNHQNLSLQMGIHSGAAVAGVVGVKQLSYDIWGETVKIAHLMNLQGCSGEIQVSDETYQLLREKYELEKRETVQNQGQTQRVTYWLKGRKH